MNDTALHFDHYAFEKPARPVSAKTNLSFDDISRMHTMTVPSARTLWIPEWSADNKKMALVVCQRAWQSLGNRTIVPDILVASRTVLDELVRQHFARPDIQGLKEMRAHAGYFQARGYIATQVLLAYKVYRLRKPLCPEVSEEMGIPTNVLRQWLFRLNKAAENLGYQTFPQRHHTHGRECRWIRGRRRMVRTTATRPT